MRSIRAVFGVALAVGALALTGCASDPDTSELATQLASVEGVRGATVAVGHPGAPWNTSVVVRLFVDEPADADLVRAVQDAAPILAEDPTTSRHGASIIFIDGEPGTYANSAQELEDKVLPNLGVFEELGVAFRSGESVGLTPEDLTRLASAS